VTGVQTCALPISAQQAIKTANLINDLFESDLIKIASLGRARFSCEQSLEYLKKLPQVTVPLLSTELGISAPTARAALNHMIGLGILEEMSGKKRDKVYVYRNYLNILEDGAFPFK
jgi:Fic family protein